MHQAVELLYDQGNYIWLVDIGTEVSIVWDKLSWDILSAHSSLLSKEKILAMCLGHQRQG